MQTARQQEPRGRLSGRLVVAVVLVVTVAVVAWSMWRTSAGVAEVLAEILLATLVLVMVLMRRQSQRDIDRATTHLREAEAEARSKSDLLEVIVDNLAEGVTAIDEHGVVLVNNRAAREILGVPASDTTSEWQSHYGVFRADGTTIFPEHEMPMVRALSGESSDHVGMLIRNSVRPDGLPIEVSARPYQTPNGQRGSVGVFRDISERHAAEVERSQRERLLTGVVETAQNAFVVIDVEGYVLWWNHAAERILGWAREDAVGRLLSQLIVPERLRDAHAEGLRRRGAGHPPRLDHEPVQLRALRRDGTEIDVELTIGELHWEDGLRFHAFIRDVSDREAGRRQLEQSEARFRLAFENAPIGKVLTNLRQPDFGKLIAANPAVEKMLGYSEAELRDMSFRELTHPEDAVKDAEWVPKLLSGELDRIEYEKRYIHKHGRPVWVALTAVLVRAPDGTPEHSITQILDVTERRATAERLVRLNDELQEANAELDGFAATVAHDLKNPLTAIAGMVEVLDDVPGSRSPDEKRALAAIARTTDRMGRMIDDMLSYSRAVREDIAVEPVDLHQLVHDVVAEVAHTTDRQIQVDHGSLPRVDVHPVLFRQVLCNLLGNAVKYVAAGIEPRVVMSVVRDTDRNGWTLRMEDNGIGIPEEARERVFVMFHREASAYRGTGIGLATCRKIVERHGGRIWIEGGTEGGSVVSLWMPGTAHPVDRSTPT